MENHNYNNIETFNFNDREYNAENVSEKALYLVQQINECQFNEQKAKMTADQFNVAAQAFTNLLGKELDENPQNATES